MLCRSCRKALSIQIHSTFKRHAATTAAISSASSSPSVISSSTPGSSQPLSTPFFPSTSTGSDKSSTPKSFNKPKAQGSILGGSELKGLAYLKTKPQVLAKEDDEYPAWLWTILEDSSNNSSTVAVDVAAMTKKQRAKYERKQERLLKDIPKPVPVHEQSRDLTSPGDSATVSLEKRQEVTKSAREARRKSIRESNFLRGM